ncbi:hypothetical protein FRC07_007997 [Ceratobasidium sp. 392]|nr:hypothetical protein FRC07_007997 [Ceratobasidium sp. 392]
MVVCKWQATFVRFDRAGILHSKPIDMREQREEFCKAFAGLMMLNEEEFGYDTAFTTRARSTGRLEFYVDLPVDAIPPEGETTAAINAKPAAAETSTVPAGTSDPPSVKPKLPTRRFRVMERLCHRKSIRGRATIVLRVREVIRPGFLEDPKEDQKRAKTRSQTKQEQQYEGPELLATKNYVLKLMWRDPNKKTEGEVLERLVGIYGVAQYMWHSDVFKTCGRLDCAQPMVDSCGECLDKTPSRDRMLTTKNMTELNIYIPEEPKDEEPKYEEVKTDEYSEAYARRTPRIYCRLLVSTVGSPLCSAENPRQLVQAVLDAVLGYWRLVNMGLLHRDISDGNVLLLQDGDGYSKREWKNPRAKAEELDPILVESEKLLQSLLHKLNRDPTGMLNDFDLFTTHSGMGALFFGDSPTEGEGDRVEVNPNETGEPAKRRKLNTTISTSVPSSSSGKGKECEASQSHESSIGRVTKVDQGARRGIDFRTGTPTFMSLRVLEIPIGQSYQHSFMDDLESFFWLILWCILERDERGNTNPGVDEVLNLLDQSNLAGIASEKSNLLAKCVRDDGDGVRDALARCKNVWATDPMVIDLILEMGTYFNHVSRKKIFQYSPNKVFPKIVKMITDALDQPRSSPTGSDSN